MMISSHKIHLGFNIIELMVTISIIAITAAIAAPSFTEVILSNRRTAQVNGMVGLLNFARSNALIIGSNSANPRISICPANSAHTACAADWSQGLLVFTDQNANGSLDAGEAILRGTEAMPTGYTLSVTPAPAIPSIGYLASGYPTTSQTSPIAAGTFVDLGICDSKHLLTTIEISAMGLLTTKKSTC
jgi:type IV fimbrial biogenesis protein FimT